MSAFRRIVVVILIANFAFPAIVRATDVLCIGPAGHIEIEAAGAPCRAGAESNPSLQAAGEAASSSVNSPGCLDLPVDRSRIARAGSQRLCVAFEPVERVFEAAVSAELLGPEPARSRPRCRGSLSAGTLRS